MRRAILLTISICALFVIGCDKKAEFLVLTQDNKEITNETCDSIIASIDDVINLKEGEEREDLEKLRDRLSYMKKASGLIDDYAKDSLLDTELFLELIKLRSSILKGEKQ